MIFMKILRMMLKKSNYDERRRKRPLTVQKTKKELAQWKKSKLATVKGNSYVNKVQKDNHERKCLEIIKTK